MGLALKIKEKMTPDTLKSGGSQGGETNMHPNRNEKGRASPPTSDDELASHNGTTDKTQAFRSHRSRDSGIEIGHDSRFIEHVDAYPPNPERAPTGASQAGTHAKKNPVKSNYSPDQRRKSTTGGHTPGVNPVGGGRYSNEPATGPSTRRVPAEGAGAFTSSKAGINPDYLTLEDVPGDNTPHTRNSSTRPSLQNTRAYKSDAPLGVRKRSIVDGYGKDPSSPDSRLVMEKPTCSPAGGFERGRGPDHEARRPRAVNPGVTPDTSTSYLRDYAADFTAGGRPRSDTVSSTNSDDEFGPGLELRKESSVERATVPYAGELDRLDDSLGRIGFGRGKDITYSTLLGVKDSGIGRGGIHNGVVGNGASR